MKSNESELGTFEQKRENHGGSVLESISDKLGDVKDKVVDTTKGVANKTRDTLGSSVSHGQSSGTGREYEEGQAGTEVSRNDDPLTEFRDKEPMTPAKLNAGEPTAVRRDPNDQTITSDGQTSTDTPEAQEEYRKRGMTKVDTHDHSHDDGSSCSCGSH